MCVQSGSVLSCRCGLQKGSGMSKVNEIHLRSMRSFVIHNTNTPPGPMLFAILGGRETKSHLEWP